MALTVKNSITIKNDDLDSFEMGITYNGKYTTTGKKSGEFDKVMGAPIKMNKDPTYRMK